MRRHIRNCNLQTVLVDCIRKSVTILIEFTKKLSYLDENASIDTKRMKTERTFMTERLLSTAESGDKLSDIYTNFTDFN